LFYLAEVKGDGGEKNVVTDARSDFVGMRLLLVDMDTN